MAQGPTIADKVIEEGFQLVIRVEKRNLGSELTKILKEDPLSARIDEIRILEGNVELSTDTFRHPRDPHGYDPQKQDYGIYIKYRPQ